MNRQSSMRNHRLLVRLCTAAMSLCALFALNTSGRTLHAQSPELSYDVIVSHPGTETFRVTGSCSNCRRDSLLLKFAVWAPGAYDIVNFGQYVENLSGYSATGESVHVERLDTNTWLFLDTPNEFSLSYHVNDIGGSNNSPWFSVSVIDQLAEFAFANGTALFGYFEGMKDAPHQVTYYSPPAWRIDVALERVPVDDTVHQDPSASCLADSYDALVDAPVFMGKYQSVEFDVAGIPHRIAIESPVQLSEATLEDLRNRARDVVELMYSFFGDAPIDQYLFQIVLEEPDYTRFSWGALEHLQSSTYGMPYSGEESIVDMLVPVIAHEYFHIWSPKLIHVSTLGPFDYQSPPKTTSLWFHEGVTEYYAHTLLAREELTPIREYLTHVRRNVDHELTIVDREPITQLSKELPWRAKHELFQLYTRGPLIAMMLDVEIRLQTDGRFSLDDAMRHFNVHHGDHNNGEPFADDDIIRIISEATGTDLDTFFSRYIAGAEALPLDSVFARVGLKIVRGIGMDAYMMEESDGWRVRFVRNGGTAHSTGLERGDVIRGFALNSGPVHSAKEIRAMNPDLDRWLDLHSADSITVVVDTPQGRAFLPLVGIRSLQYVGLEQMPDQAALRLRQSMFGQ